jgi:hypothetical protein
VIATEGKETEKLYFDTFRSTRVQVKVLATGARGDSAPDHVLARLGSFRREFDAVPGDSFWLMVDVDRWGEKKLALVCQLATQKGYRLAVSNPCFELWLWLHFGEADPKATRSQDRDRLLQRHLGGYNKSKLDPTPFTLQAKCQAVARARALDAQSNPRWPSFPGSHVYRVVEELLASTAKPVTGQ